MNEASNALLVIALAIVTSALASCASEPPAREPVMAEPVMAEPMAAEPAADEPEQSGAPAAEPSATEPAGGADARWAIALLSQRTLGLAQRSVERIAEKGYEPRIEEVEVDGETWYRVLIPGRPTVRESRELIPELEKELDLRSAWVAPAPRSVEAPNP